MNLSNLDNQVFFSIEDQPYLEVVGSFFLNHMKVPTL
jgi:hypothetical protein